MKKAVKWILIAVWVLALLGAGFFAVSAILEAQGAKKEKTNNGTLAVYATEETEELFAGIPSLSDAQVSYEDAIDDGNGYYGIRASGITSEKYRNYVKLLSENGFRKYTDNGEKGLGEAVFKTYFEKDAIRVSVTYFVQEGRLLISAAEGGAWSEHLVFKNEYTASDKPGAKTRFILPELYTTGASFIIQLKNGHFILNDGGTPVELPYLLDDLESFAPEGEKPVIEAWIISHPHTDHMGVFQALLDQQDQMDRIIVENVFFNDIGKEAETFYGRYESASLISFVRNVPKLMKNSEGKAPAISEVSVGDRLYFGDLSIEVPYSSEMLPYEEWISLNGSSLWLNYTIEGQKVLVSFDGTWPTQKVLMKTYDRSYFDVDVYTTPHHGYDVFNEFTDYFTRIDTVVYSNFHKLLGGESGNSVQSGNLVHLNEVVKESYTYGEGTLILEFPREVGEATVLEPRKWMYNGADPVR